MYCTKSSLQPLRRLGALVVCILVAGCDRAGTTKTPSAPAVTLQDASAPATSPTMKTTNDDATELPGVEVLVSCAGVRSTGKRHNSFFFTFRIEQEIQGELGRQEYTSQEIFWDFGAAQIVEKLGMKFDAAAGPNTSASASCAHRGVLKLVPDPDRRGEDATVSWRILWVAREDEAESARALERVARALMTAVERKELAPVRRHLAPESNFTEEELLAVARAEERHGHDAFTKTVYAALLGERGGVAWVGGRGADYTIEITRGTDGAWTIGRIDWRRRPA